MQPPHPRLSSFVIQTNRPRRAGAGLIDLNRERCHFLQVIRQAVKIHGNCLVFPAGLVDALAHPEAAAIAAAFPTSVPANILCGVILKNHFAAPLIFSIPWLGDHSHLNLFAIMSVSGDCHAKRRGAVSGLEANGNVNLVVVCRQLNQSIDRNVPAVWSDCVTVYPVRHILLGFVNKSHAYASWRCSLLRVRRWCDVAKSGAHPTKIAALLARKFASPAKPSNVVSRYTNLSSIANRFRTPH